MYPSGSSTLHRVVWITDHVGMDGGRELQLRQPHRGGSAVVWRTPYPFRGALAATFVRGSEIWIVGPMLDPTRDLLASLILRLRLTCGGQSKAGREIRSASSDVESPSAAARSRP